MVKTLRPFNHYMLKSDTRKLHIFRTYHQDGNRMEYSWVYLNGDRVNLGKRHTDVTHRDYYRYKKMTKAEIAAYTV